MRRPEGVTMIAIWFFIQTGMFVLGLGGAAIGLLGVWTGGDVEGVVFGTMGIVLGVMCLLAFGAAYLFTGLGLWRLRDWSRSAAIVLAVLQLLLFPVGTIAGILIIRYLNKNPEARAAFGLTAPAAG